MIDEYLVNTIYLLGSRLNRWRMGGTFRLFRNRSYLGQVLHTLEENLSMSDGEVSNGQSETVEMGGGQEEKRKDPGWKS